MITWQDDGIVIGARKHAERHIILTVLTKEHGRHKGIFSPSKDTKALAQSGTGVHCVWKSRLSDHLGTFKLEPRHSPLAYLLQNPLALKALTSVCCLLDVCLPERESAAPVYKACSLFLQDLSGDNSTVLGWLSAYCRFEIELLAHAGIRLDLETCAVTGGRENLTHVSPRSGRAVSATEAAPYLEKLLSLPSFLRSESLQENAQTHEEILAALTLSGYFLSTYVFTPHDIEQPLGRQQFIASLRQS